MCHFDSPGQHLKCVLDSYAMRHVQPLAKAIQRKAHQVKTAFAKDLGMPASKLINVGAMPRQTALNTELCLDILLPFPFGKADHPKALYEQVAAVLDRNFEPEARRAVDPKPIQALGLEFHLKVEDQVEAVRIDLLPGIEAAPGDYRKPKQFWFWNAAANCPVKTNLQAHRLHLQNAHPALLPCIRVLKVWKTHRPEVELKSFMLELLVVEAFRRLGEGMPDGLWAQVKTVLKFIRDEVRKLALPDPANPANAVHNLLNDAQKKGLAQTIAKMLTAIEANPKRLREYFPDNANYCMANRY